MVFFRNPEPGLPDGDAPRLLRMSPLHHSFRVTRPSVERERVERLERLERSERLERHERYPMLSDDTADAASTASAPGAPEDGKFSVLSYTP